MRRIASNLIARGARPDRILFLNMESLANSAYKDIPALNDAVAKARIAAGERLYLFIDEVQEIPSWERAINSFLADDVADIFISGSNSSLLSGELASLITGRYMEFRIHPLVYSEFKRFRQAAGAASQDFFSEFLRFGGFPGIHKIDDSEESRYLYLTSLSDSVILKDIVLRNNVRDVSLLERLLAYVAENCGNIFSARSIADYLKNERRTLGIETVYNYLSYFESACVIHRVPRYDMKGKRLLETHEKYYLEDIGLRHSLLGYRESDIGKYLENIVYLELLKRGYDVRVGRMDKFEIDFIATRRGEKIYIQVAYLLADESTREREFRPLMAIGDNHPKYVLTMDTIPDGDTEGIKRGYLPRFLESE